MSQKFLPPLPVKFGTGAQFDMPDPSGSLPHTLRRGLSVCRLYSGNSSLTLPPTCPIPVLRLFTSSSRNHQRCPFIRDSRALNIANLQDFHIPFRPVGPDPLSVLNQPGSAFHTDNCGQALFSGNDGTAGHHPAYFCHQTFDAYKHRRPTGVSKGTDLSYLPCQPLNSYPQATAKCPAAIEGGCTVMIDEYVAVATVSKDGPAKLSDVRRCFQPA